MLIQGNQIQLSSVFKIKQYLKSFIRKISYTSKVFFQEPAPTTFHWCQFPALSLGKHSLFPLFSSASGQTRWREVNNFPSLFASSCFWCSSNCKISANENILKWKKLWNLLRYHHKSSVVQEVQVSFMC